MINNYIQGFRLINAIVRSLPAANIETLLTDAVRASAFTKACGFYSQQSRFLETPLALQNLALSAKAYALLPEGVRLGILNDQTAIQNLTATILGTDASTFTFDDISQFVGDQAVMGVVFSSEPASQVIAASATAMNAIVNSGAALSVLWGKAPAIAALKMSNAAKKAFVDGPYYAQAFKPAVLNGIILGEQIFTASGTFTVPAYVTKLHVVCVGKGGDASSTTGGSGGALCYANNKGVTPNESLGVVIDTTKSSFLSLVAGAGVTPKYAGDYGNSTPGGTYSGGDGGGNGGPAYAGTGWSSPTGGGGAGGYSGDGGRGAQPYSSTPRAATDGLGGAAGGGNVVSPCAGSGGGVGIYGQGTSGTAGSTTDSTKCHGIGGSAGAPGSSPYSNSTSTTGAHGGAYGGGASGGSAGGGLGGPGVVRIIWGASRAFPSTNVEKIV